jgi:O-antigen biosynthesis protein WbqP
MVALYRGQAFWGDLADRDNGKLHKQMKRLIDIYLGLVILTIFLFPLLFVALLVRVTSPGPVLYWSDRVGKCNRIFKMPKFRSMRMDTPVIATHLLQNPEQWLTPVGSFLRKYSLDELPQLWSVLKGDMSFVGPRPALFNQNDLIAIRTNAGVHELVPGLTGWAQVNGRDELPIPDKVRLDVEYLQRHSIRFDFWILWLTLLKVLRRDGVSH